MDQIGQSSAQQPQDPLQQQQLQQRKRKQPTSSGAANSTGTGNTVGPSNSPPSIPSTHNAGDGVAMSGTMQHGSNMPKKLMMYNTDGPSGFAASSNQMDDLGHSGNVGSLEYNVESFSSHQDDGDGRDTFAALKSSTEHNPGPSKGFSFNEVACMRTSNSKVVCCHFSSDGKILASGGHEKKAVLWNMDTLQTESTPEGHTNIISDICFRPNSTHLATSSFDRTVRYWNAAEPNYCLNTFTGHGSRVISIDFHPNKTEVLCSCDGNGEIRIWNVNQNKLERVTKGASAQVRFQPRLGRLFAAASENRVSIRDFETDASIHSFQVYQRSRRKEMMSVCWNNTGEYLATAIQDSVKVWSIATGECIHKLRTTTNNFHSCVFHPYYSTILVIGGYKTIEVWNMMENETVNVAAHEGLIAALAQSPTTGMVASASHDKSVRLWK